MVFVFPNPSSVSSTIREKAKQDYSNANLLLLNGGIDMGYEQNDTLNTFKINYYESNYYGRIHKFSVSSPSDYFSTSSENLNEIINSVIDYLQKEKGKNVKEFSILPFKAETSSGTTYIAEFILMVLTSDAQ